MNKTLLACCLCALLLGTAACSVPLQIKDHARRTNQIVWQVHAEMILKNILRARDHQPMLFTSVDQVRGSLTYTAGTGALPVPFGGDANNVYGINPTASITSSPSFDVTILLDEDFYRGILSPIPLDYIKLYVEQGWPIDELLLLTIESYPGCDNPVAPCDNSPQNGPAFDNFVSILDSVTNGCSGSNCLRFGIRKPDAITVFPEVVGDFNLVAALQAGYTVEESGGTYTVRKSSSQVLNGPCVDESTGEPTQEAFFLSSFSSDREFANQVMDGSITGVSPPPFIGTAVGIEGDTSSEEKGKKCGEIVFRSPQGVIYYLGESLRPGARPIAIPTSGTPQFVVECDPDSQPEDFVLSVPHDGVLCGIPGNSLHAGDSLRTLSFVSQLLGLERSAKSLRTTGATQVIN